MKIDKKTEDVVDFNTRIGVVKDATPNRASEFVVQTSGEFWRTIEVFDNCSSQFISLTPNAARQLAEKLTKAAGVADEEQFHLDGSRSVAAYMRKRRHTIRGK